MAKTRLDHYADVQKYITDVLRANGQLPVAGPHRNFWETLSYDQFVTANVPGINDPNTGAPMPILVLGNSAKSNIILALRGASGTVFDPDTGAFGRMPATGPPFFTDEQIAYIADWIDRGCPK